jgi:hypothetical protein
MATTTMLRWLRVLVPVAVGLPVVLACTTRPIDTPREQRPTETRRYFPQSIEKDIDLLFVIDNSNSMEPEQQLLREQFPLLIEGLRSPKLGGPGCTAQNRATCAIPNVHIGVVSSDLGAGNYSLPSCEVAAGDGGKLQAKPRVGDCVAPDDPYISYVNGKSNVSTGDSVEDVKKAFSCIANLGTGGCGFEHQLEAARRALRGCGPPHYRCEVNPGFIRKEAFLAIVWITDEDDCSARKPQLFDPSQQGPNDPLGPLTSFRCTEFGIKCDKGGRQPGVRKGCAPGHDWLEPVETYARELAALKPPGRVFTFAIAGPTEPFEVGVEGQNPVLKASCQSIKGTAVPAVRIEALIKAFGERGHFNDGIDNAGKAVAVNSCSNDFSPAMKRIADSLLGAIGGQCIGAPLLTKSGAVACHAGDRLGPGGSVACKAGCLDKVDCQVTEIVNQASLEEQRAVIDKCPVELFDPAIKPDACGASCPCWRIIPRPQDCTRPAGSPYGLQIMRKGEAVKGAVAEAACATAPYGWDSGELAALPQCN